MGRISTTLLMALGLALFFEPDLSAHPIAKPIVLEGTIVTPQTVIQDGKILIKGEKIRAVGTNISFPKGSLHIKTGGIIYPGLIDLHNHITWNLFPRWNPPTEFANRYHWRQSPEYQSTYRNWNRDLREVNCERNKYGELKALIGGVTSVQGSLPNDECIKGLVRNLDFYSALYGKGQLKQEKLDHVLDIDSLKKEPEAEKIRHRIKNRQTSSFLIHLAEGKREDSASKDEFNTLAGLRLLGRVTGIIHGTAFGESQFKVMRFRQAKLIWSPKSNLELYKETTDIAEALRNNILVALAPDWSITGSENMLGELKIARDYNHAQAEKIWKEDKELVFMATMNPAKIAALDKKIGNIKAGRFADLLIIRGNPNEPYKSLVEAKEEDIELVLIGGQPYYGNPRMMQQLGQDQDGEEIEVCNSKKLLHLTHHDIKENPLNITFKELTDRLQKAISALNLPFKLAPLFECR